MSDMHIREGFKEKIPQGAGRLRYDVRARVLQTSWHIFNRNLEPETARRTHYHSLPTEEPSHSPFLKFHCLGHWPF